MAANHHHTHWHLPLFAIEIVLFKFSRAVGTLFLFYCTPKETSIEFYIALSNIKTKITNSTWSIC